LKNRDVYKNISGKIITVWQEKSISNFGRS